MWQAVDRLVVRSMIGNNEANEALMRTVIQRIATGPELSKDLSYEQAQQAMQLILAQHVDPVQAAIFFIALRMKRETDAENNGVLSAIRQASMHRTVAVDELVDLFEPYNGYIRCLPLSPFIPAVLAAAGLPAYSHGVDRVGPKYGVTHEQVFAAAGIDVSMTVDEAAARVAADAGWAYLSQSQFCPQLAGLSGLRHQMVKRSVLTTVEGLAGALAGRRKTHLITGYVHKAYPRIYLQLAHESGYDTALVLRGVEGGITPSLRQKAAMHRLLGADVSSGELDPNEFSLNQESRAVAVPAEFEGVDGAHLSKSQRQRLTQAVLQKGLAVLAGAEHGTARAALIYGAAIILWHCGRARTCGEAARQAAQAIDSGEAKRRFQALVNA